MEPACNALNRALQGDVGAQSFLDRTSSIYLLDATDSSQPKTYGCWNFIHQALNEVERFEASQARGEGLVGFGVVQLQLLSTMALRVARRSNLVDKNLVATCIGNAVKSQYNASTKESQELIHLNIELRDIVMGRIAAMAFDHSFHRQSSQSAFSDPIVMETFCAVLAANAVSNGPSAVDHLVSEWIVPSARNLPPFALACVTLHLASEALRKSAPAYTQDMLQRLSNSIMAGVLAPVLSDSIQESSSDADMNMTNDHAAGAAAFIHARNNRTAAIALKAMDRWCLATDLSLAQIKHICSKVQISIVDVICDAMYSDSRFVIDALAEFIEAVLQRHRSPNVSDEHMTQVRYIMQVDDEASFKSNISPLILMSIESKEMDTILEELISAIGLQRFRFIQRQNNGDHDLCRNLTRIAASACMTVAKARSEGKQPGRSGPGLVELLLMAVAHPSVNICGISTEVLSIWIPLELGLSHQLLPTLQRRAITPHHFVNGVPCLAASDICGVNHDEFQNFRETILADALIACWKDNRDNFMASCTSAIEEFCSSTAAAQVSFHLEAALFCLASVAEEALATDRGVSHYSLQLQRCTTALAAKPTSLTSNPLTLAQMCRFLRKYDRWYANAQVEGALDVATEMALSTFNLSATAFTNESVSKEMRREGAISPYSEAAKTLQTIICHSPQHFVSNQAIAALGAGWETSYAASNCPGILKVEDRQALCVGICHVLASLPDNQRDKSLHALAMPTLDCLETMTRHADHAAGSSSSSVEQLDIVLDRIADEIKVLTTMARTFTNAFSMKDASMESGCRTSDGHAAIVEPAFAILHKAWPSISHVASKYCHNEVVADSLGFFLTECFPPECQDDLSVSLVKELCAVAFSTLQLDSEGQSLNFKPIMDFLQTFVKTYGDVVDKTSSASLEGQSMPSNSQRGREIGNCLESLLLSTVDAVRRSLGSTWTSSQRQGQGQPPFESKAEPIEERPTSSDALSGMFTLLRTCAERCPIFLMHLPAASSLDVKEDMLHRRAVDAAVSSIIDGDTDASKSAMEYLESTVKLTQSSSDDVRQIADNILSRVRWDLITTLLIGACGKLSASNIGQAADLFSTVLTSSSSPGESDAIVFQALMHEGFLLGSDAQRVSLGVLRKVSRNEVVATDLAIFLGDIWELHQVEYSESLEGSDAVAGFCRKYAS